MWNQLLFAISALCGIAILVLGLLDFTRKDFIFWPPPEKGSWQDWTFITLFRGMLYPLIALSVLHLANNQPALMSVFMGGILLLIGFGLAFASTSNLGWKNAFGDKQGLVTEGWFAYSRNPVYVVTWIGMIGWAILVQSTQVWFILFLWAVIYVFAIFLEERWLTKVYGQEFLNYKRKVRRFI
ncbi:MAG: PEMT/PEM2 methyltransferase family protein [Salaquimonas sp.]